MGLKGTLQIERGDKDGKPGYTVIEFNFLYCSMTFTNALEYGVGLGGKLGEVVTRRSWFNTSQLVKKEKKTEKVL